MLAVRGSRARGRRLWRAVAAAIALATSAALAGTTGAAAVAATPAPAVTLAGPVDILVLVPITAPADTGGLLSAEALAEYTATEPPGLLSRQLDAVAGTRAVLAVDPMILASIRVLGSAAPESARQWLARLDALANERVALPYADADPALFARSSAHGLPGPGGFAFAIDPAFFADTPAEQPTPTPAPSTAPPEPTPDPDQPPAIPTDAEAVELAGSLDEVLWPRPGTLDEADLALLSPRLLVLTEADLTDAGLAAGLATVEGARALVVDTAVSEAVSSAARVQDAGEDWTLAASAAVDALAAAVVARRAAQPGSADPALVVIGLDRLAAAGSPRLAAAIAALTAVDGVRVTGLSALLGTGRAAPEAALAPTAPEEADRIAELDRRLRAEAAAGWFATAVEDPAAITDPERLATLALGSQAWTARDDWPAAVGESVARVDALLASVRVVESNSLFLADRSRLPVAIQNDSAHPVTLLVTAEPRTSLLDIDKAPVRVVVPAQSQATVDFEATAVSNGTVLVTVRMTSPAGVAIGTGATVGVNVQAGWETPLVAAAALALVALLLFGIVRTIRRHRASVTGGPDG